MPIIANLVLGRDGGTTCDGRSAPLSSAQDRERFHKLRAQADVIVIGGETARAEPYGKTPVPLYVLTRSQELPHSVRSNPLVQISNEAIPESLRHLAANFSTVLIEGGVNFLREAISADLIDDLYITQVQRPADGPFFDYTCLERGWHLLERVEGVPSAVSVAKEGVEEELFLHYARLPKKG